MIARLELHLVPDRFDGPESGENAVHCGRSGRTVRESLRLAHEPSSRPFGAHEEAPRVYVLNAHGGREIPRPLKERREAEGGGPVHARLERAREDARIDHVPCGDVIDLAPRRKVIELIAHAELILE